MINLNISKKYKLLNFKFFYLFDKFLFYFFKGFFPVQFYTYYTLISLLIGSFFFFFNAIKNFLKNRFLMVLISLFFIITIIYCLWFCFIDLVNKNLNVEF